MNAHPRFNQPLHCPACKGFGLGTDGKTCISCKGSRVLYVTTAQYAKIHGDAENMLTRRPYSPPEKQIIRKAGTPKKALMALLKAGFVDRTYIGVRNWLRRNKVT